LRLREVQAPAGEEGAGVSGAYRHLAAWRIRLAGPESPPGSKHKTGLKHRLRVLRAREAAGTATAAEIAEQGRLQRKARRRMRAKPRWLDCWGPVELAFPHYGVTSELLPRYGAAVCRWLELRFMRYDREHSCADNFRAAAVGDLEWGVKYLEQRDQGCCGQLDEIATYLDGQRFFVGCNHGH
jgi:hypothetical protein